MLLRGLMFLGERCGSLGIGVLRGQVIKKEVMDWLVDGRGQLLEWYEAKYALQSEGNEGDDDSDDEA